MLSFLIRRLNLLFITAFILTIISFIIVQLLPNHLNAADTGKHNIVIEYLIYLFNLLTGTFGYSVIDNKPLLTQGLIYFASTLELCLIALLFSSLIAIPLGLLAGLFRGTAIDNTIMTIVLAGIALPVFWVGVMAVLLPSLWGDLLPVDGNISVIYEVPIVTGFPILDTLFVMKQYGLFALFDRLAHLFLPAAVLSLFLATEMIRLTRNSMTTVMRSNYIKAAYAKGFSRTRIVFTHVLRNALPPIIPQLRLQLSTILSSAMAVEIVFNLDGMGTWLITALKLGDYYVLPAGLLIISGFILFFSIIIEVIMVLINPLKRGSLYANK